MHGMQIYIAVRCGLGTHLLELILVAVDLKKIHFFQMNPTLAMPCECKV